MWWYKGIEKDVVKVVVLRVSICLQPQDGEVVEATAVTNATPEPLEEAPKEASTKKLA
jgi:hypothetical protein